MFTAEASDKIEDLVRSSDILEVMCQHNRQNLGKPFGTDLGCIHVSLSCVFYLFLRPSRRGRVERRGETKCGEGEAKKSNLRETVPESVT